MGLTIDAIYSILNRLQNSVDSLTDNLDDLRLTVTGSTEVGGGTISAGSDIFIKSGVLISGTQAAPETLTTNLGKLATYDGGLLYPSFDLSKYNVSVVYRSWQEATVDGANYKPTTTGGKLIFKAAVSDGGKACSDNYFRADILIFRQSKTL